MRALPPLSCINYNRPRCSAMLYNKKKVRYWPRRSTGEYSRIYIRTLVYNTFFSRVQRRLQCSASVSCIHYSRSRSAIMIYSPSHPHTTHNMPTHTFILFRIHNYTDICAHINTRIHVLSHLHLANSSTHQHQWHYNSPFIEHVILF